MTSFNKVEKEIQKLGLSEVPTLRRATIKLAAANQMIVVPHARVYALPTKSNSTKQQFVIVPQEMLDHSGGGDQEPIAVTNGD